MWFSSIPSWLKRISKSPPRGRLESGPKRRCRPSLEVLEDRTVPSTFTVTNLNDAGASGSFPAGTRNGNGSFVGTGAAPLDPLLEPLADNGSTVVLPDGGARAVHRDDR